MTLPPAKSTATEPTLPSGAYANPLDGRYRLEECLGEGALGVVWRARHVGLHRDFALKQLRTGALEDPAARARFAREAEALGRMRHPHIVEVTDFGIDPGSGSPYLVMELLSGRTLADLLRNAGPLPVARALPLLEALASAIDAAHEQGILHRDLKPSNIALTRDAAGAPRLKILDFGLADVSASQTLDPSPQDHPGEGSAEGDRLTSTGMLLGTPLYAAPEVIRDSTASRASDIYSLGVIAYELLTGRPPFQGSTSMVLAGHLHAPLPEPALPTPVVEALHEALRKDPDLRPATAGAFVRRLLQAVEQTELIEWQKADQRRFAFAMIVAAVALTVELLLLLRPLMPLKPWLDHVLRARHWSAWTSGHEPNRPGPRPVP